MQQYRSLKKRFDMENLQIIDDYKNLAIPLDMIARKNNVSLHRVTTALHQATIKDNR